MDDPPPPHPLYPRPRQGKQKTFLNQGHVCQRNTIDTELAVISNKNISGVESTHCPSWRLFLFDGHYGGTHLKFMVYTSRQRRRAPISSLDGERLTERISTLGANLTSRINSQTVPTLVFLLEIHHTQPHLAQVI